MITVLTNAFNKYMDIEFQDFTAKFINAYGLFEIIKCSPADKLKLEFIEDNTCKDVMISFYKLDRTVNPTKGEFKFTDHKLKFLRNDYKKKSIENQEITLTENQIQHYLCVAIREVHQIVMRSMKPYKIEEKVNFNDETLDKIKDLQGLTV